MQTEFEVGDLVQYKNAGLPIGIVIKVYRGVKTTYDVTWIVQGQRAKISNTCEEAYYMQKVQHV